MTILMVNKKEVGGVGYTQWVGAVLWHFYGHNFIENMNMKRIRLVFERKLLAT